MSFKRNQIEEAVWRVISQERAGIDPATVFRTRVKRLIELDRSSDLGTNSQMAFSDDQPTGRGNQAEFSDFNAFCLCLGVLLLNAGFKQSEVVFLLQHIRIQLEDVWDLLEACPAVPRQLVPAPDRPTAPSYEMNGFQVADTNVYVVLNKVELTETIPQQKHDEPLIFEPLVLRGSEALSDTLRDRALSFPTHIILEVSVVAAKLKKFLQVSKPKRRGPG